MKVLKPLSLVMVLFVGAAFAADGVGSSRGISQVQASAGAKTVSVRSSEHGGTVEKDMATSRAATSNEAKPVAQPTSNTISSRTGTNARGTSNVATRNSDEVRGVSSARRVGVTARSNVSDTGRRIVSRNTDAQEESDSENRAVSDRSAYKTVTKESIAEAKGIFEQTAELNKSCQTQYNECMDQFCAVVDSNQKRCSCSSNLSRYSKVEEAVKKANSELNDVAQNIRYVGLSADEIRAIMTATEAEEALAGTKDNTENRNMLEQIEKMIKDPKTSSASYAGDSYGLDMSLDFTSDTDMFNLDFLSGNTSTSFSNLRGSELYNAARSRCNSVLTQCKKAGATVTQVTGNYDLSIDKDCVAYEAGLKKMNETLVSNVRSAERMLQKARLAVVQNKNQYDAKGCIAALETCMIDDMVCGDDYFKCVDPTKRYIDESGEVILGQDISKIKEFMKSYNNADINSEFLSTADNIGTTSETSISETYCSGDGNDGRCMVKYLLQKIGVGEKVTDGGLCRAVLDKCQLYTYSDNTYQPYNEVVVNYIQRALVNIKAAQYKIISDYASDCMVDVAACYNQQVTQVNSWSSTASTSSVYNIMNGACRSVALTCGLAIFAGDPEISPDTALSIGDETYHIYGCDGMSGASSTAEKNSAIIGCVSDMFYQSLLCPDNSTFTTTKGTAGTGSYVNSQCVCDSGYTPSNGYCVANN